MKITCAFCGNEPIIEKYNYKWVSECIVCGIRVEGFDTQEDCESWWRRRGKTERNECYRISPDQPEMKTLGEMAAEHKAEIKEQERICENCNKKCKIFESYNQCYQWTPKPAVKAIEPLSEMELQANINYGVKINELIAVVNRLMEAKE